ncbi:putative inner membrane protein [compost metagenome]
MLISGAIGAVIAAIVWLLLIRAMDDAFLWMSVGPGLMAGMVMGWIVPSLPFRGEATHRFSEVPDR